MSGKISIIMPMYGVEQYIGKAIESVLSQTYSDWELLIVNDGSKDNSRQIAYSYAEKDDRITVLDKANGGLSDARNYGLIHATGKYVHFFDSDDYIDSDYYTTMLSAMQDDNACIVISGYTIDFSTETIPCQPKVMEVCLKDGESPITEEDLISSYLNFAWNKLYHKQFLSDNNLFFEKGLSRIEDSEFISRVLSCLPKLRFVCSSGYHYVQRIETTLSTYVDSTLFEHYVRSLHLYDKMLSLLNYPKEAHYSQYNAFVLRSIKSYLNRLFSGFPQKGSRFYYSLIKELVDYLHDNDGFDIRYSKSAYALFLAFCIKARCNFAIYFVYSCRHFVKDRK